MRHSFRQVVKIKLRVNMGRLAYIRIYLLLHMAFSRRHYEELLVANYLYTRLRIYEPRGDTAEMVARPEFRFLDTKSFNLLKTET